MNTTGLEVAVSLLSLAIGYVMKHDIHPSYDALTATCSCGNVIHTFSTRAGTLHLDVCSACHPFYTGKQKVVDSGGRVDRFNKRFGQRKISG